MVRQAERSKASAFPPPFGKRGFPERNSMNNQRSVEESPPLVMVLCLLAVAMLVGSLLYCMAEVNLVLTVVGCAILLLLGCAIG